MLAAAVAAAVLTGCGPVHDGGGHAAGGPSDTAPSGTAATRPAPTPDQSAGSPTPDTHRPLAGRVVVIDPGHNDGNFQHTDEIDRQVNAGGFRKACDTTGTETDAGYTEASFTIDVARWLGSLLEDKGAKVVMTRTDDHSVGPCVDRRAAIGNDAHADVALSIHADGGPADGHGFHIMQPTLGSGHHDSIVAPSHQLALALRDAYRSGTGLPPADYIGTDGINPRSDMAGLNLSAVPKVLVECGNMRNSGDARRLSSTAFRKKIAAALAVGISRYLGADASH